MGGIRYLVKAAAGGEKPGRNMTAYDGWELSLAACSCVAVPCLVPPYKYKY